MDLFEERYPQRSQVLERLKNGKDRIFNRLVLKMSREKQFHLWMEKQGESGMAVKAAEHLENALCAGHPLIETGKMRLVYAALMEGKAVYSFQGKEFTSPASLAEYVQTLANRDAKHLSRQISPFTEGKGLAPDFLAWLLMWDQGGALASWAKTHGEPAAPPTEKEMQEDLQIQALIRGKKDAEAEALRQSAGDFAGGFEKMLRDYPQALEGNQFLKGLLFDLFPEKPMACHLIFETAQLGIREAIEEAEEVDSALIERFTKQMIADRGVQEGRARWACTVWAQAYGIRILGKKAGGD